MVTARDDSLKASPKGEACRRACEAGVLKGAKRRADERLRASRVPPLARRRIVWRYGRSGRRASGPRGWRVVVGFLRGFGGRGPGRGRLRSRGSVPGWGRG